MYDIKICICIFSYNTYDIKTSYGTAEYFLCPYLEENYPTYEIKILVGYHLGWHTIHIKRFN